MSPRMPPLPPRTFCAPIHAHTKAEARSEGLASLGLSSFTSSSLSSFTSAAPLLPVGDIYKNMDAKHGSLAMLARGRGPPPFAQQGQGQHTRPPLAQLAHQSNIDVAARQERALYGMYNNGGYRGNCSTTNCASPQQYSAMNRNFEAAATGGGRGQGGISGGRREGGPPSAYSSFLESSTNTDCNRGSVCARDVGRAGAGEQLNGDYGAYASFLLDSTSHASHAGSNNCATKLNLKAFGPSAYEVCGIACTKQCMYKVHARTTRHDTHIHTSFLCFYTHTHVLSLLFFPPPPKRAYCPKSSPTLLVSRTSRFIFKGSQLHQRPSFTRWFEKSKGDRKAKRGREGDRKVNPSSCEKGQGLSSCKEGQERSLSLSLEDGQRLDLRRQPPLALLLTLSGFRLCLLRTV